MWSISPMVRNRQMQDLGGASVWCSAVASTAQKEGAENLGETNSCKAPSTCIDRDCCWNRYHSWMYTLHIADLVITFIASALFYP